VVTGGASGIGRALVEELAARGARVVVADLNEAKGEEVARAAGGRAVRLDVTDAAAVQKVVDDVVEEHGQLDYMFNNAGIAIAGEMLDLTLEDWYRTLDVDLKGVVHGVYAAYRVMAKQGSGHIINTASMAGLVPSVALAPYAAAKHGVVGLSTSLRVEGEQYGVRVSVVCPGVIETGMQQAIELRNIDRERMLAAMPIKPCAARDCARAILRGVERNDGIILVTAHCKALVALHRYTPALYTAFARKQLKEGKEKAQIEVRPVTARSRS
jgi:NAD(P)-dependent dehydrogenase (short-subunit alcohol dehydrogenase family)